MNFQSSFESEFGTCLHPTIDFNLNLIGVRVTQVWSHIVSDLAGILADIPADIPTS
jgi:hypothetical protein